MTDGDIEDKRNVTEAEKSWDSGIAFGPTTNTYRLMRALLTEGNRMDQTLEEIYDQHHINFATGDDLDKIGDLVNIDRNTGESDARYRARIKGKFRAATIDTTFDQFAEFVASVLNTEIDNIDYLTSYASRPAAVTISTQGAVYDALDLQPAEIKDVLDDGVPAGHEVRVVSGGTFRLKADGDTNEPDKGLTSDAVTSGGTLAEDLVQ